MKKLVIISLAATVIIMAFAFTLTEKTNKGNFTTQNKKNHIEVIDFYGTHRCVTCKAIEANTRYTLNTYFATN